jgi:hypothetical protein
MADRRTLEKISRYLDLGRSHEKAKDYFMAFHCYSLVMENYEPAVVRDPRFMALSRDARKRHDALFRKSFFKRGMLVPARDNPVLRCFRANDYIRDRLKDYRWHGNIGLLKEHRGREKGVICVHMYKAVYYFALMYDLEKMRDDFRIIIFPSFCGYADPTYYNYIGRDLEVFVSSPFKRDSDFITSLGVNLVPTSICHGDTIEPFSVASKGFKFDICTCGYNDPYKNYSSLIRMLGRIEGNERLRIFFAGIDADRIGRLCDRHGLRARKEIGFLKAAQWRRRLATSRVFILNSVREGHPKILTEAFFANVPVMMNESAAGPNRDFINPQTGLLFNEGDFELKLKYMLKNRDRFSPRSWAVKNTGCFNAHRKLNRLLREAGVEKREPWSRDIALFSYQYRIKYHNRRDKRLGKNEILDDYLL